MTPEQQRERRIGALAILDELWREFANAPITKARSYALLDEMFPVVKKRIPNVQRFIGTVPGYPSGPYEFQSVDGRLQWRITNASGRAATNWEPCNVPAGLLPMEALVAIGDVMVEPTLEVDDE